MTPKEFAYAMGDQTYDSIRRGVNFRRHMKMAKKTGIVIAYGFSRSIAEFRGAWDEEIEAYNGTTVYASASGPIINKCEDNCPYFHQTKKTGVPIHFEWDACEEYSWIIKTAIPHETFDITEDDEKFSRGIIFAIKDIHKAKSHTIAPSNSTTTGRLKGGASR